MQPPENQASGFYFALPRLVAHLSGGNGARSEQNWIEANIVGGAIHLIAYLCVARVLLGGLPLWSQLLLAVPVAFVVWILWSVFFPLDALLIAVLRRCGLMRGLPDDRAQGFIIAIMVTALTCWMVSLRTWMAPIGAVWLLGVTLNVVAAGALALLPRQPTP